MKVAVVGAGWAGLAAAVALREAGHQTVVLEAAHTPGGRARRVDRAGFCAPLDNGQHILLGAYGETLDLMRRVGCPPERLLRRLPLDLRSLDGSFRLHAPKLPAPLHAAAALLGARGLGLRARWAALRLMAALRAARWRTAPGDTVGGLLQRHAQPASVQRLLWEPLCLAALNTPAPQADAQLFAHVLRDSLTGTRAASDLLLPSTDLSALWPDAAAAFCGIRYGTTVRQVVPVHGGDGGDGVHGGHGGHGGHHGTPAVDIDGERFDAAILAVAPAVAARLLPPPQAQPDWRAALETFSYAPIATLTLALAGPWRLPSPMLMLHEDAAAGAHGQWVFDRAALAGAAGRGEVAIVTSVATALADSPRDAVIAGLTQQLRDQAAAGGLPPMPEVVQAALLIDKRATFLATPGLRRPDNATPWPGIAVAGDWTNTGYPGVLEGAVRSGRRAAALIMASGAAARTTAHGGSAD